MPAKPPAAEPDSVEALEQQNQQRSAAKRATLERMLAKAPARDEFDLTLPGEEPMSFLFESCGHMEYDKMMTKCPPTVEQRSAGDSYDIDKFAPMLFARVCQDPVYDVEEWSSVWKSDRWNRGEAMTL